MPIPIPTYDEQRNEYISRCVSFLRDEGRPEDEAVAICIDKWNENNKEMKNYKTKTLISEISDVDVKSGIVTGYFSAFNNVDKDKDMIVPGAFKKTISDRGPKGKNEIYHLLQHDIYQPLGKPRTLKEDNYGLYFETKIVPTSFGTDTLKLYAEGVYDRHSIGYIPIKEEKVYKEGTQDIEYYKLTEIYLYEGSTVTFAANDDAIGTGMKSMNKEERIDAINDRMDKLLKALKVGDLTDDTYMRMEIELRQIQELYKSLVVDEPGVSTHDDEPMNYLRNNLKLLK